MASSPSTSRGFRAGSGDRGFVLVVGGCFVRGAFLAAYIKRTGFALLQRRTPHSKYLLVLLVDPRNLKPDTTGREERSLFLTHFFSRKLCSETLLGVCVKIYICM